MRARGAAALLVAGVVGCGGAGAPSSGPSPRHQDDRTRRASLAERALEQGRPIDYDLPFSGPPPLRTSVVRRFRDLCARGDHRACWIEAQYGAATPETGDYSRVAANCAAGDMLSCRALPLPEPGLPRYPDLPGGWGRSKACLGYQSVACDHAALHRECVEGFRNSCLMDRGEGDDEARVEALYRMNDEDCSRDMASACSMTSPGFERRKCELTDVCYGLGLTLDALGARDAFERECQYQQSRNTCAILAGRYIDQQWSEPVTGRGLQLMKWACTAPDEPPICTELRSNISERGE